MDVNLEMCIRYQNELLLFRLENSERNEPALKRENEKLQNSKENNSNENVMVLKKNKMKKEVQLRKEEEYEKKLEKVEKVLSAKTSQSLACIRRNC